MTASPDPQSIVRDFPKANEFFIGVDSDGCAFDTMEVKHKECFIPNIIKHFRLAAVSKLAREVAEFLNLYSTGRGINRFPGLALTLDMLRERPEVARRNFEVPTLPRLREWMTRETKLGNPALKAEVARSGDPELAACLAWSEDVNRSVEEIVKEVPPFPLVRESLQDVRDKADVMVVSATPCEALEREWAEHGLAELVALIAGQELGSKKELLALAAVERYPRDKILMVGDAPGDLKAAKDNDVLFFPIDPGFEDESWERFRNEALGHFFAGTYRGRYMDERIAHFESLLPAEPPWKRA